MTLFNAQAGERTLIGTRRAILAVGFIPQLTQPLGALSMAPVENFLPPGPLAWLPQSVISYLLQPSVSWLLTLVTALALALGIWQARGWGFILSSTLGAVGLLVHQAICRGYGHNNHAELGLLMLLLALPAYALADRWQQRRGKSLQAQDTLVALTFLFLLSYVLVGALRFSAGPGIFDPHNMWAWMVERTAEGSAGGFFTWESIGQQPTYAWLLAVGFPVVTLLELLAPLALVWKAYRYVFLVAMLGFHLGVVLFMRLVFVENMLLLLILLVDWAAIVDKFRTWRSRMASG